MEIEMSVFESDEFGPLRTALIDGVPWFVGRDVAAALGYSNTGKAVASHVDAEDRQIIQSSQNGNFGIPNRGMAIINESGVYSLILSSKLPGAKRFKRWVTAEVLPCIRRHGGYLTDTLAGQAIGHPEMVCQMADAMLNERQRNRQLERELSDARPKADYYDAFVSPDGCTNIRATAKELDVPERKFTKFLQLNGYLYRNRAGTLLPYAKERNRPLFHVREACVNGRMRPYTVITPKGKGLFMGMADKIRAVRT